MNKRLKYIIAIVLTLAMAGSGSCVFAGTVSQPSEDEDIAAVDVTVESASDEAAAPEETVPDAALTPDPDVSLDAEEGEGTVIAMAVSDVSVNATTVNKTAPSKLSLAWSDPISFPVTGSDNCKPVQVNVKTSGMLWFDAQRTDSNSNYYYAKVYVGKYNSSTNQITYYDCEYLYPGDDPKKGIGGLSVKKGTYYIGIEAPNTSGSVKVRAYVYPYATRTLAANKYMMASGKKSNSNGYYEDSTALFKIKPSKTGYIRVYLKNYGYTDATGYVTLLNSKKKTVSEKLWYNDGANGYHVPFGVKKGKTYYLKVTGTYGNLKNLYVYGIKYKTFAAPARSNTSKSKAKKLKRKGKYIKTAMLANGKSGSQWYKFKVTKKRTTQIKVDATNVKSGTVKATAYCGKKKIGTTTIWNGQVNTLKLTNSTTYGKAAKGTYYIKIHKSKKATGQYKIKYQK